MTTPANLMLRLAVVIGGVTLLAGLSGVVMLALRPDVPSPRTRGTAPTEVHVQGIASNASARVEVEWFEGEVLVTQAARPGEMQGVWILPPVPDDSAVLLRVRRGEGGAVLHQVSYEEGLPARIVVRVDDEAGGD